MNDIIYHYCDNKTFDNIIKNKKIWLSDIMKSNDYEEINAYLRIALDSLEKKFDLAINIFNNNILVKKQLFDIINKEIKYHIENSYWMAICFTDLRDDIYQWRSYAEDGKGYAIGFNANILSHFRKGHNCVGFNKIIYDENIMLKKIDEIVLDIIKKMRELSSGLKIRDEIIVKNMFPFISQLLKEASFYKNKGFYSESETRLVYHRTILPKQIKDIKQDSLLNFLNFSLDKDVKTRIEIDFEKEFVNEYNNLIKEVIIGPCNNGSVNTMHLYLRLNRINNCEVHKSNISYRCK
jgi:hypothetical protein